jgi:hypothetical protein
MAAMLKKLLSVFAVAALTFATCVAAQQLRENHPDTYVVKKGDTLWDISGRFLKQPWLWPEIWQANPQIENPHLIYPGDVISLAYLDGRPQISVDRREPQLRRDADDAIRTIPLNEIESFLKRMHVLEEDPKDLPYVLAIEESRLRGASGQVVYARGADFRPGQQWAIVRPTVRYAQHPHSASGKSRIRQDEWSARDGLTPRNLGIEWAYYAAFDKGFEVLGWEVAEVTTAEVTVAGDPATLLLSAEGKEVRPGDLLLPVQNPAFDLSFLPRAPQNVPEGMRVLAVTDYYRIAGPRDVVALSAGAREGIANGQVFALYDEGDTVADHIAHRTDMIANMRSKKVKLPDEFVGHVMIFRTFDKISYGLVMDAIRPAGVDNLAKAPDRLP